MVLFLTENFDFVYACEMPLALKKLYFNSTNSYSGGNNNLLLILLYWKLL